ncbi:PGAP1-like protein [Diaminobutyricimonas aerilata]|uniref:PGAP1-like protein n=1 Tax=Diaminobutyricimonas aerilata TaxID=1162967 RepID=A0A2M9CJA9_9MICO|nr:PGAP1-like protein [Diaminobutyricimonas aerilata]
MRMPVPVIEWASDWVYATRATLRHLGGRWPEAEYTRGSGRAVLLIPGVYETWQFMRPIADRLVELGHPVHALDALGYNRRSIRDSASLGQAYLRKRDLTDVVIVAHSKGGLIGKHMMAVNDRERRVAKMVTVNTPFSGSPLARIAVGRTLREFRPAGETVRLLSKELEVNSRITSISSKQDPFVPPDTSLTGGENLRVPIVGHFRPLGNPEVIREVVSRV